MTSSFDPLPEWAHAVPSEPGIHPEQSALQWQRPFTVQQLLEIGEQFIEQFLAWVVRAVAGVFIPGEASFDQLRDWALNIPILGDIIDLINSILSPIFGGIDFSDGVQPAEVWETVTRVFIEPLNLLIGPRSLLAQLFGQLGSTQPVNLLSAGAFAADSITSNTQWLIDLEKSRSSDGSGAAKVVADGTQKAIHTEEVIAVAQSFTPRVFIAHEGYAGTGVAVRLQVIPHRGSTVDEPVDVGTYIPTTADVDWPGYELTGVYEVPAGVTGVQVRFLLTEAATAGTFYFDDASASQSTRLKREWIDGLPEELQDLLGRVQLIIDTIVNALRGTVGTVLNTFDDLVEALQNINPANILGALGAGNIAEAIQEFLDHLVGGLVGQHGSNATLPDLFNTILQVSSNAAQGAFAWLLAGISTNKPVDKGLLPSGDANYPYSNANTWLPVTQNACLAITYRAGKSEPLGVIGWLGKGSTNITAVYVNVRKINKTTGARDLVHHSPNLVSLLPPGDDTVGWVYYQLDEALPREIADEFEIEPVIVGTGTHYIRGYDEEDDIPDHPYANVKSAAAVRDETTNPDDPVETIAKSAVVKSSKVPWIETAVDTGSGSDHHDPVLVYLGTNQTTMAKPRWANAMDLVGVGGSGAGRQASLAQFGEGGSPGKWNAKTYIEGDDFEPDEDVLIEFTPGAPGAGGTGVGGKGGDTVFVFSDKELRCEGGAGGDSLGLIGKPVGRGAGTFEYNGQTYLAGGDQKVPGRGGVAPGGGGNGGDRFLNHGGPGAPGGGWVKFYRRAVDAPTPEPVDTTPPTPPTTEVVRTSFSVITVRPVGSIDE
ncbi:minor tail protein [Mycobacterium phage Coco12]|uniref:Minor tail protein n=1 Tax=Mycobacterium phage Phanphagia TaxID=2719206 RepID=A0A6G9LE22_9CAUD|nr:minor tail protein [Mycobacterium phage Kingsley]QIQ63707.1 minor tail protein [Mycobacterium phage Phanphagia]QOP65458.1 minor tail protein [Mycobacterium phage Coco12]